GWEVLGAREGEVLERLGARPGGRGRGSGETVLLRRRLEELEEASNRLKHTLPALKQALAPLASLRELEALRARVESLKARLRNPLPPPPPPPSPPEGEWEERMARDHERIEAERKRLEEALAQAEAHERWHLLMDAFETWKRAQEEVRRLQGQMEALKARLAATGPLVQRARELEMRLAGIREEKRKLQEAETRLLTRANALLAERENLRLLMARREALLEELAREQASLPQGERVPGTPRTLQAKLAQAERERALLGPINALAERELALVESQLEVKRKEVLEANEALLRLQTEIQAVEREYAARLKESFQLFQKAFREYALALLGAQAEVRREGRGLRLLLIPSGKRTQDLRLLSVGEKTLGALAFLFALGELQGGLPLAVLDEVDAALDDANLARFTHFLQSGRQFILITHQRRTMEACQTLYGVTVQNGISRVYSIRKEVALEP
ncbi:MAG: chromosome segregation protein SMC, partial [Thermus sp.]|nr:chromosome segregation protein SMC [Thermus sp.]